MKTILTTGWNFMRVLRIVIGIWALAFTVRDHDVLTGVAGALILFTGFFNVGCCTMRTCGTGYNKSDAAQYQQEKNEQAVFEEIK